MIDSSYLGVISEDMVARQCPQAYLNFIINAPDISTSSSDDSRDISYILNQSITTEYIHLDPAGLTLESMDLLEKKGALDAFKRLHQEFEEKTGLNLGLYEEPSYNIKPEFVYDTNILPDKREQYQKLENIYANLENIYTYSWVVTFKVADIVAELKALIIRIEH